MSQKKDKNPKNQTIVRFLVKEEKKSTNLSNFINQKIAAQVEVSEQKIHSSEHATDTPNGTNNVAVELAEEKKKKILNW